MYWRRSTHHDVPKYPPRTWHASCYRTTMSLSQGQANNATNSTRTFVTALVVNGGLLFVQVAVFLVLKQRLQRIYSPRTFLPPLEFVLFLLVRVGSYLMVCCCSKRASRLPNSWWRWLPVLIKQPSVDIVCICRSLTSFYWLAIDS